MLEKTEDCDKHVVDIALFILQSAMLGIMGRFVWMKARRLALRRAGPPMCCFFGRLLDFFLLIAMLPVIYFATIIYSFWCIRKSNSYGLFPTIDEHETKWMKIVDPSFSSI